jgi:hypothetical protein
LSKAVKALNTQRKEDSVKVVKAHIQRIARRVVNVMRGIRMLLDKKRPKEYTSRTMTQNVKNNAWAARHGLNYKNMSKNQFVQVTKTLVDRAFGGLSISVSYNGAWEVPANENGPGNSEKAHWRVHIGSKTKLQSGGTQFWINNNTQRIAIEPYADFHYSAKYPDQLYGIYPNIYQYIAPYIKPQPKLDIRPFSPEQRRVFVKAIVSAIFKEIVTQWNALPVQTRLVGS